MHGVDSWNLSGSLCPDEVRIFQKIKPAVTRRPSFSSEDWIEELLGFRILHPQGCLAGRARGPIPSDTVQGTWFDGLWNGRISAIWKTVCKMRIFDRLDEPLGMGWAWARSIPILLSLQEHR